MWAISLCHSIQPNIDLEDIASRLGGEISKKLGDEIHLRSTGAGLCSPPLSFTVQLHRGLPETYLVAVATVAEKEWHRSDLFMIACWSMLKGINDAVGEIHQIQWQPRMVWRPWSA